MSMLNMQNNLIKLEEKSCPVADFGYVTNPSLIV